MMTFLKTFLCIIFFLFTIIFWDIRDLYWLVVLAGGYALWYVLQIVVYKLTFAATMAIGEAKAQLRKQEEEEYLDED